MSSTAIQTLLQPPPPSSPCLPCQSHSPQREYGTTPLPSSSPITRTPSIHKSPSPIVKAPAASSSLADATSSASVEQPVHPWLTSGLTYRLSTSRKSPEELKRLRSQGASVKVTQFYEEQNELIDDLLMPLTEHDSIQRQYDDRRVTLAVRASLIVNIMLFVCQVSAATSSASMSLIAAAMDAFMDLLSGVVLLLADRAAKRQNVLDYPTGKRRFETIGVIVFASLMASISFQLIIEAIRGLTGGERKSPTMDAKEIILISVSLVSKLCLFIYCRAMQKSTIAKTLVTDHRNDLFLNSFGLAMSLLSAKLYWWLDPVGGLGIGLLILRSWSLTAWENVQLLIGRSAPPAVLNKITYIAATHHPKVLQVDTCRAYWLGSKMFVEVDIVLPPEMTLHESHDIGEDLQIKLENLPNVERAFVHVDYEFDHSPEHRLN